MTRHACLLLSALLLSSCAVSRENAGGQEQILAGPVAALKPVANPSTPGHALAFTSELPWTVKGVACQRLEVSLEFLPAPPAAIAEATGPEALERKLWATPVFCLRLDCLAADGKGVTLVHELPAAFPAQVNPTLWITGDGRASTTVGAVQMTSPAFVPVVAVDLMPSLLLARRATDPACATVRSGLGPTPCWASFAEVAVGGGSIGTLAIHFRDPATADTTAACCPDTVWFLGLRRDGTWLPARPDLPWILRDQPCGPPALERNADGVLTGVTLSPWRAPIDPLLDGLDADDLLPPRVVGAQGNALLARRIAMRGFPTQITADPMADVPAARLCIETLANERLIEWKGRELAERLSGPGAKRAGELAIRMEKGLLRLDLKVRQLKDAIDTEARKPGGAAPRIMTDRCHLLEQRKAILTASLQIVRKAGT